MSSPFIYLHPEKTGSSPPGQNLEKESESACTFSRKECGDPLVMSAPFKAEQVTSQT